MPDHSVIIPSHNDRYLHKTINSVLQNFRGDFEVIVVLDGYTPSVSITSDPRVFTVSHPKNMGMREAINTGVATSRGKYITRADEHVMFGPAYNTTIELDIEVNHIMFGRRFFLDPIKWTVMEGEGHIDYEKLLIVEKPNGMRKFAAVEWRSRARDRKDILIDETMAFQGSVWTMHRAWWDSVIVRLDSNGYGTHYQDTTEMAFKTWKHGGKLMLNKKTWYAHKHRDFNRTHHYPHEKAIPEMKWALEKHMEEYQGVRKQWGV